MPATRTRKIDSVSSNGNGSEPSSGVKVLMVPKAVRKGLLVPILGLSPLIVDNGASAVAEIKANEERKRGPKTVRPPRDPDARFRESMYLDPEGRHVFPALGIKKSLVTAGYRFAEETGTRLYGLINIETTTGFLPILNPDGSPWGGEPGRFEVQPHMREDFVRRGGLTPDVEWRAEYMPWRVDLPVAFLEGHINEESILNLVALAGETVGIGSWRVEKKGISGRFRFIEDEVTTLKVQ